MLETCLFQHIHLYVKIWYSFCSISNCLWYIRCLIVLPFIPSNKLDIHQTCSSKMNVRNQLAPGIFHKTLLPSHRPSTIRQWASHQCSWVTESQAPHWAKPTSPKFPKFGHIHIKHDCGQAVRSSIRLACGRLYKTQHFFPRTTPTTVGSFSLLAPFLESQLHPKVTYSITTIFYQQPK